MTKREPLLSDHFLSNEHLVVSKPMTAAEVRNFYEQAIDGGELRLVGYRVSASTDEQGRWVCSFCKTQCDDSDKFCRTCGAGLI